MKRFFSFLAAATMLFAASCTEDSAGTDNGNEAQVTFNLGLEGQSGTRAIGDGSNVTKLSYFIFDANGNRLGALDYENKAFSNVTPKIQLAKDQVYTVVFWAQKETNAFTINKTNDGVSVSVNYENANDEARDAFFADTTFRVTGSETINVILRRPFAQVNVGVTAADYTAAENSGVSISHSYAKITGVYNTLNLLNGEVSNVINGEVSQDPLTAEFALAARPSNQTLDVELNGTEGIQDDEKFEYLSMNYILVGENKNVSAEFIFKDATNNKEIKFNTGLDVVPVERNHRTNIIGQILTGNLDFNVKIDASFKDINVNAPVNTNVSNATEFHAAVEKALNGEIDVIGLNQDIQLVKPDTRAGEDYTLVIPAGKTLSIDLNGHTLWAQSEQSGNREMFLVKGTLNIVDGTITYEHKGANMGWSAMTCIFDVTAGGVLNLHKVTAKNLGGSDMAFVAHLNNWGEVTLNVENCTLESPYVAVRVFNSGNDMNNVTIKNSTLKGVSNCFWVHNYTEADFGTQEKADAHKALLNVNIFNGTNTFEHEGKGAVRYGMTNAIYYLADGLCQDGKTYTVTNANGLVALSGKTINGGETVKLGANIDLTGVEFNGLRAFNSENNNTFDGQGYTISNWTYNGKASDMGFIKSWVGPIKNVKFENCHLKTAGRSAIVAANVYCNIDNVTVNNCSIEDSYWACGIIAGLYNSGSISNCTVTNSSVKSNGGTGAIVGVINETAGTRSLTNCKVEGCTVNNTGIYGEAYSGGALVGMFNADATYKISNCSVSNNTLVGEYVYEKYPAKEGVVVE